MRNFILAYCSDNKSVIQELEGNLSNAGFEFNHLVCGDSLTEESLASKVKQLSSGQVVLLFISDNFLRSASCMYQALLMIKNLNDSNRLLTVITDGISQDPLTKQVSITPTSFERVSNVIQYMNYWQEQYLAMRKQKRELKPGEEQDFEHRLKIIRSISTEIGEFLRYLRSLDHVQYEVLKENDYELFFNATNNMGLYLDYKKNKQRSASIESQKPAVLNVENEAEKKPEKEEPVEIVEEKFVKPKELVAETGTGEEEFEELEIEELSIDDLSNGNGFSDNQVPVENGPVIKETPVIEPLIQQEEEESDSIEIDEIAVSESEAAPSESSYELLQSLFEEEEPSFSQPVESSGKIEKEKVETIDHEEKPGKTLDSKEIVRQAQSLFEEDETEKGIAYLAQQLSAHPENEEIRYHYAEALLIYNNDQKEASSQLELLLEYNPNHIRAQLLLAEIAESKKDLAASLRHYSVVYKLMPAIPGLAYKLAALRTAVEHPDINTTANLLKEALKLDPMNVDARYQYAVLLYEDLDKSPKAVRHLEETLRLAPEHPFANYDLALIYHDLDDLDKATYYYQQAYQINPELQTPENDQAFRLAEPDAAPEEKETAQSAIPESTEVTTAKPVQSEEMNQAPSREDTVPLILITGATSGIGFATASLFAEKGFRLILTGRRNEKLEQISKTFKEKYKIDCHILNFDVRNVEEAKQAIDSLPAELKEIDVLINNAGLAKGFAPIHEGDIEDWETMIDTNIKGLLYMTRVVSPHMVKRRKGHIINICSSAGHEVYPNGNVYCATKYAVDALTKSMRLDLYKHNIRVSQVSPGHVEETDFALVRFDGDQKRAKIYDDFNPLKSYDVAEVIWFIATRPPYVNIQDVLMMGTQQANNNHIDRSGRSGES